MKRLLSITITMLFLSKAAFSFGYAYNHNYYAQQEMQRHQQMQQAQRSQMYNAYIYSLMQAGHGEENEDVRAFLESQRQNARQNQTSQSTGPDYQEELTRSVMSKAFNESLKDSEIMDPYVEQIQELTGQNIVKNLRHDAAVQERERQRELKNLEDAALVEACNSPFAHQDPSLRRRCTMLYMQQDYLHGAGWRRYNRMKQANRWLPIL